MEELLEEHSPEQRAHQRKMDRAYHYLSIGFTEEADALFDEILSEEPFNRDAMTGKNLIARSAVVGVRLEHVGERVQRALLQSPDGEESSDQPKKELKPKRKNPLRSKKLLTGLVIAFVMLCGLAAAFVGTSGFDSSTAENPQTEYTQQ